MTEDDNRRDTETRKLEALASIAVAISTLGSSLTMIVRDNAEQGRLLRTVDGKIDLLTEMVGRLGRA